MPGWTEKYQVIFSESKFAIVKLLPDADKAFLFGFYSSVNLSGSRLQSIYFGQSGLEHLKGKYIPEGTELLSCQGLSSDAIAEYCLLAVTSLKRGLPGMLMNHRRNKWTQVGLLNRFIPTEEIKIGIFGLGVNGRKIAAKLSACGFQVYGCDLIPPEDLSPVQKWFESSALREMATEVDYLILSVPLTEGTKGIVNLNVFASMKQSAFLINVARGEVVLQKDLIRALKQKMIAGAMLDTLASEPLSRWSGLWQVPNLFITPHIAGNVNMLVEEVQKDFIKRVLQDE